MCRRTEEVKGGQRRPPQDLTGADLAWSVTRGLLAEAPSGQPDCRVSPHFPTHLPTPHCTSPLSSPATAPHVAPQLARASLPCSDFLIFTPPPPPHCGAVSSSGRLAPSPDAGQPWGPMPPDSRREPSPPAAPGVLFASHLPWLCSHTGLGFGRLRCPLRSGRASPRLVAPAPLWESRGLLSVTFTSLSAPVSPYLCVLSL